MPGSPYRPLTWIHQLRRHSESDPNGVAIRHHGETTTWLQLQERAARFAHLLQSDGVGHGDRVVILLTNRSEYLDAVLGANLVGAIAVPVNFRLTASEISYMVADSGATFLLSEESLAGAAAEAIATAPQAVTHLVVDGGSAWSDYATALAAAPTDAIVWPGALEDVALIMYTSGTTGAPKGAMLTYQNLMAQTLAMTEVYDLMSGDEISLITSPLFHIAALGAALPSIIFGHTTVITPTGAFEAETFLDLVESERVTTSFLVPTQWQAVCDSPTIADRSLSLKSIAWGAAPATPALLRRLNDTFPGVKVVSVFGQTEMSPNTCLLRGEDAVRKIGSIGTPLRHVQVRVVDPDMNDVPVGSVGEIVYRGPTVMRGYWNKPEATADAFAGGWFHSGDLVRVDQEGYFYVVDRLKDMIISGGENIYCAEVEAVIADHPLVRDVALIGEPHPHWGETPIAIVTPSDATNPPREEEIIALCREKLASFKKPSRVVVLADMPRNASGKILKSHLRELLG